VGRLLEEEPYADAPIRRAQQSVQERQAALLMGVLDAVADREWMPRTACDMAWSATTS